MLYRCRSWSVCPLFFSLISDIAKYCISYSACALTNDSDFFVYQIPGMIHLNDIVTGFQTEGSIHIWFSNVELSLVPKSVTIYSVENILEYFHISYQQLLCAVLFQGNDFIPSTTYSRIPSRSPIRTFGDLIQYIKRETSISTDFGDFFTHINRSITDSEVAAFLNLSLIFSIII